MNAKINSAKWNAEIDEKPSPSTSKESTDNRLSKNNYTKVI